MIEYGDEFVLQNQFINNPNYLNICGPSTCYNNTGKMNVNTIKEISNVFTNIWSFMKYYNYEINCESNIES